MSNTILVTGSTGKVGKSVVEQLAARGTRVRAAVQATSRVESIKKAGAETVVMDFNKAESIGEALKGVEKVFLLIPPSPNLAEVSASFVGEAKRAGVKHIVRLSVMGANIEPGITLGRWHRETERQIEDAGIAFTHLRPTFFMQNFLGQPTIKSQGVFFSSAGDGKASHIDTRDIASVAAAALTESGHEGKAYDLTGGEALSNSEIADILSSVTGKRIICINVSDDDIRKGLRESGVPEWLVEPLIELSVNQRAGHFAVVSPAVEQVTGRRPITFEQFARDHIEAFR